MRILTVITFLSLFLAGTAAPGQKTANERPKRPQAGHEAESRPLGQVPDLPNLPQYTGTKKFLNGTYWPYQHDGPSYILNFSTQDEPSEVERWWHQSLKNSGWKITIATEGTIVARKSGCSCYVNIMRGSAKGDRTKFIIGYHRRDQ